MRDSEKIPAQSDSSGKPFPPVFTVQDKVIDSKTLFTQGNAVLIQHCGDCYVLRRTRQGKLILTK